MNARALRASEVPPLFTRVPPGLFGPLTGAFAPLYWTILSVYYHYEFEGEPFELLCRYVRFELEGAPGPRG